MSCETSTTAVPSWISRRMRSAERSRKSVSPTAITSSTKSTSGRSSVQIENARRASMPSEYARTGTSRNPVTPAQSAIASIRARTARGSRPSSEP